MASFELLDRAANGFETRLRLVTCAQRTLPTPRPELNVHDLVTHQIRGMRIYTLLLHGAAREVVAKEQQSDIGSPAKQAARLARAPPVTQNLRANRALRGLRRSAAWRRGRAW
jgi:hypothetical protein